MTSTDARTWTSYRTGRVVMHSITVEAFRYFVQKTRNGYAIDRAQGNGIALRLAVAVSLKAAKQWVADYVVSTAPVAATAPVYAQEALTEAETLAIINGRRDQQPTAIQVLALLEECSWLDADPCDIPELAEAKAMGLRVLALAKQGSAQ